MNREQARSVIENLVERYAEHRTGYQHPDYNEQKTRLDFINPFFKALGWDIDNEKGDSEAYREVIYEDKVKVKGKSKAPDYGFRLSGSGNKRLFYLEAKKPSIPIKVQKESAYQLRRYGSSAQVPVSILTNFEDFIIYDCTRVPREDDSATVARLKHISYKDYVKEFDFIYDTFSHEAVTKGRFDKFVQGGASKRGTDTLDKRFVENLDKWRKYIATNIAHRNDKLTDEELNYAVQQTLDRLIFLRFCEDRAVEPYAQMKAVVAKGEAYKGLMQLFKEADAKYNSGLFDFKKDTITPELKMDPKVIRNVINEMYYPECNFEFSVMPVEILGNAYEQFLGKVIRILPSRAVRIEEKPEVRKAGGVYYTPQYIVEYIVKNTVGKLIEGKTPKEIEKIKIVDPACGSGSFLLGAFDYLLRYHVEWYHINGFTAKKGKESPFTPQGTLTTHEKKRILRSSIFGVDLDANAVEVSKLSLLLKCMEGETEASMNQQMTLHHERVLPNLDDNIKDGNSLIETDFYDTEMDLGYDKKIKPFSWKKAFPEVFKQGGFDAVVGNPPWGADLGSDERPYLIEKFPLVPTKTKDSYLYFLFQSFKTSKPNGFVGLVLPNTWLLINNAEKVRRFLLEKKLIEIIDFGDNVFRDAIVETTTLILENNKNKTAKCAVKRYKKGKLIIDQKIDKALWAKDSLSRFTIDTNVEFDELITKCLNGSKIFSENCEIIFGIKPYQLGYGKPPQTQEIIDKRVFHSTKKLNNAWKPLLTGTDIRRYSLEDPQNLFIKYGDWLMYKSNEGKMLGPKIFLRRTSDTIRACYDDKQYYGQNSLFIITSKTLGLKFLLGILNSQLIDFIYKRKCPQVGKIFAEIKPSVMKELPIKEISSKSQQKIHDEIIKHVDLLLQLNEELKEAKLPTKQEQIKQRIDHSEDRINRLVYDLYELTADEIKIIEDSINA